MPVLTLDSVIDKLRRRKSMFERDYGVKRIGVFGSFARNEADETSDVDIVVEMTEPDLFYLVHIKDTLAEDLERPIDIVGLRETMNIYLKKRIQSEAVYA
jgi:predicted nucleotidyltransferase